MSKIIIFHLSDLHIEKAEDTKAINVQKIVDVLNTETCYEGILVVISGDIAFSGKHEQYNWAYHMFVRMKNEMIKIAKGKPVDILVVPGNHDVDLSHDKGSQTIERIITGGDADKFIFDECSKQKCFTNFSNGLHCCTPKDNLIYTKRMNIADMKCNAILLNTALFSTRENDKGLHYLPLESVDKINSKDAGECSIAVMHHSVHWFHESVKSILEEKLLKECQLIFYGHEHNIGTQVIEKDGYRSLFLAGGELCNKGNWENSEFYFDIWDTQSQRIEVRKYRWNPHNSIYENKDETIYDLKSNRICEFKYDEEFEKNLYKDEVNSVSDNIFDYYVFPAIERIKTYSTVEEHVFRQKDEFIHELLEKKKVAIFGGDNAGKTVLLRDLFLSMNCAERVCLFCDVNLLNSINYKKILRTIFRQNYKDRDGEFDSFMQMPKERKVICIDGIESIEKHQSNMLLHLFEEYFEVVIYVTKEVVELDPTERFKQTTDIATYYQYKILPFYADKRKELVKKIIEVKYNEDPYENQKLAERIEETLKALRKMYSMNPSFIIQSVEYFCKNFKDGFATDGNIFSKVFESNLILAIRPYAKGITVDKVLVLLDEIAYWSYKKKESAIDQSNIYEIIEHYNHQHGDSVDYARFIDICQKAKIIRNVIGSSKYRFIDKNRLAYFIARQIIRLWNDNLDDTDLKELIRYVKYGINSNIILFITYLTDNLYLIRSIIDDTLKYTQSWEMFDVINVNVPYLNEINGSMEVKAPNSNDKKELEKKESELEEKEIKEYENNQVEIRDYFDYSTDDSEEVLNQIIRGLSLLDIVAKCLPGFEHRMNKEDKDKVLSLIYDMPSKIFYTWAMLIESEKDDLLEYFLSEYRTVYLKPTDWDTIKKEDMLLYLQIESISLLLDLMRLAINNSVKEHTFQYFQQQECTIVMHQLEYLMALTKMDKVEEVEKCLQSLDEQNLKTIPEYMWKRILRNYLVSSQKLSSPKLQQMLSLYFPVRRPNDELKKVLISRERKDRRK